MNSNNRMAINTVVLYVKLVITIIVNLYSTRLILNALGVEDYGIVNLISGIVAMLSFVQNSMSVTSQRYMSVNMGKQDNKLLAKVFNSSVILHFILALIIFTILESLTPVIFGSSIQIPEHRQSIAFILYQLTIIGTLLVVITVPYDAVLNTHENMLVFSIASIIESLIRLAGAFILLVYNHDKLIFYGCLLISIRLTSMLIKSFYCIKHYNEAHFSPRLGEKSVMKDMFSFALWNMFGALSLTGRTQGVALIMNTFLGVVINASYGIANQISGQLQNFTATISKAMNPQIMQRAGSGDNKGMISLALKQSKYSSILLAYAIMPLFFSMPFILKIWLGTLPEYCITFCSLILIISVIQQLTSGIMSAIQATGKIKNYMIVVSIVMLLNIPLAYTILKIGYSAPIVITGMIGIEIITCIIRVIYAHKLTNLPVSEFIKKVIKPITLIYSVSSTILYTLQNLFFVECNFTSFLALSTISVLIISTTTYFILSKDEREFIFNIMKKRIKRA